VQDLACDWRTEDGRCASRATHGLFIVGTGTPYAARCPEHIEHQRRLTLFEHPGWMLGVQPLVDRATSLRAS
jgi:hypothetical protein